MKKLNWFGDTHLFPSFYKGKMTGDIIYTLHTECLCLQCIIPVNVVFYVMFYENILYMHSCACL